MKNRINEKKLIVVLMFVLTALTGFSQSTDRVDKRQVVQRARIADGRRDGEVTKREGTALRMEQRHIRRAERRAKSDGEVTRQEKRRLERKQDRASRHIRRAKNNKIDNN